MKRIKAEKYGYSKYGDYNRAYNSFKSCSTELLKAMLKHTDMLRMNAQAALEDVLTERVRGNDNV